jgi:eukaryotic-like serine/threonine-protein kinase
MTKFKTTWEASWEKGRKLGDGGTGTVFEARRKDLGSEYTHALKLLNRNDDHERRARFAREAAALKKLSHPLIPKLMETNAEDAASDEALYIVMSYVKGATLEEVLKERRYTLKEAVELTSALTDIVATCSKERTEDPRHGPLLRR